MHKLRELEPNVVSFTSVISVGAAVASIRRLNCIDHPPIHQPTHPLLQAYANKGNWQGAESVIRRMQFQGVQPTVATYNALVTVGSPSVLLHHAGLVALFIDPSTHPHCPRPTPKRAIGKALRMFCAESTPTQIASRPRRRPTILS